jgi:hypothetical protein
MLSARANPPPDRHTSPPGIGARKTTGLAGLDAVLGDLVPGALVCIGYGWHPTLTRIDGVGNLGIVDTHVSEAM